jgi:Icc-related predicted phosphoesterase
MKIAILSDLHRESAPTLAPTIDGADVVVLAGDIDHGAAGVEWAGHAFRDIPVVYVARNHECYRQRRGFGVLIDDLRAAAPAHVHVLERSVLVLGTVRFLGCTLWIDFEAHDDAAMAMHWAEHALNDYRYIAISEGEHLRRLAARDTLADHHRSVAWLRDAAAEPWDGPTVVVTHHPPLLGMRNDGVHIEPKLDPAFVSDREDLVTLLQPALWICGHTHVTRTVSVGATLVVSNAHGYALENPAFEPQYIVDMSSPVRGATATR